MQWIRTHPDRLATATPAEKQKATERFQVRPLRCFYLIFAA